MYLAELQFKVIADTDFGTAEAAVRHYMEALIFNGQILGREFPTARQQYSFNSRVVIPDAQALQKKHHSKRGIAAMEQLADAGLAYPQLRVIGMDLMSPHTDPCHNPDFYVLYCRFNDTCSPVRCGTHLAPVPLYQLTAAAADHEQLIRWQIQYQALDEIQMQQNRVLHKSAERSLQQLHSALNRQGRKLARQLELSINKPVFYALYSGSSRNCAQEETKPCPGCGGKWRLSAPLHDIFDFKCDHCQLLGNVAWDCQSPP